MVIYSDKSLEKFVGKVFLSIISSIAIFYSIYVGVYVLINYENNDLFYYLTFVVVFWLFIGLLSGSQHYIHGEEYIARIRKLKKSLIIWNIKANKEKISHSEILYVQEGQYGFRFGVPKEYKKDKQGLTVFLKNGRFFRISPNMERISELHRIFIEIVKKNNPSNKFIKPNYIKLYAKPIIILVMYAVCMISLAYSGYVLYHLYHDNLNDILVLIKNIKEEFLYSLSAEEFEKHNQIIENNKIYLIETLKQYPYIGLSLSISGVVCIGLIGLFIKNFEKFFQFITTP